MMVLGAAIAIGALVGWLATFALRFSTGDTAMPLILAGAVGALGATLAAQAMGWELPPAIVGWVAVTGAGASVVVVEGLRLLRGTPGD